MITSQTIFFLSIALVIYLVIENFIPWLYILYLNFQGLGIHLFQPQPSFLTFACVGVGKCMIVSPEEWYCWSKHRGNVMCRLLKKQRDSKIVCPDISSFAIWYVLCAVSKSLRFMSRSIDNFSLQSVTVDLENGHIMLVNVVILVISVDYQVNLI